MVTYSPLLHFSGLKRSLFPESAGPSNESNKENEAKRLRSDTHVLSDNQKLLEKDASHKSVSTPLTPQCATSTEGQEKADQELCRDFNIRPARVQIHNMSSERLKYAAEGLDAPAVDSGRSSSSSDKYRGWAIQDAQKLISSTSSGSEQVRYS